MSEAWGVPPWEIWERPGAARWINRMQIWQAEAHAARNGLTPPSIPGGSDFASVSGDIPFATMPED
jgi:hypothetical protein